MKTILVLAALGLPLLAALPGAAEGQTARPEDVATIESIVAASYASIQRRPGEPFDWERFRSLHLPGARLVPNVEQTGGEFRVLTVDDFIAWVDGWYAENAPIGGPDDHGFAEEQIAAEIDRYGDVAQVMSTYDKRLWDSEESLGRGINSIQLVHDGERWWIAGTVWDEESGAGPIPGEYLPE